jgi:hypothetical protein
MRDLISCLLILLSFAAVLNAAEEAKPAYDWQLEDSYNPPDFEKFFPDDKEAGKELDKLLLALRNELMELRRTRQTEQSDLSNAFSIIDDLTLIKNGFRNASQRRSFLMQIMISKYLSATSPNPKILEILYHAADKNNKYGTRHDAIYCIIELRPVKPPAILRAFIDIAMAGHELAEIREGCERTGQLDELRFYLTPYLKQKGTKDCRIAMLLDTYFGMPSAENSMGLALKTAREIRKVQHAEALLGIRSDLSSNETSRKIEAFTTMTQNGDLFRAADESFLDILEACASDSSPLVRKHVPKLLHYIMWVTLQETWSMDTKALSVLKKLSVDENQEVRDSALSYLKRLEDLNNQYDEARRRRAAQ